MKLGSGCGPIFGVVMGSSSITLVPRCVPLGQALYFEQFDALNHVRITAYVI